VKPFDPELFLQLCKTLPIKLLRWQAMHDRDQARRLFGGAISELLQQGMAALPEQSNGERNHG
jgi:hypothetical protein